MEREIEALHPSKQSCIHPQAYKSPGFNGVVLNSKDSSIYSTYRMPQTSKQAIANVAHDILHPTRPAAVRKAHRFIHASMCHRAAQDKGLLRTRHGIFKERIPRIVVDLNVVRIGTLTAVAAVCDKAGRLVDFLLGACQSETLDGIVGFQME